MRYELWLGLRYLLARRQERFISVIAVLSIGGVALGVWALLVVLSVMNGFDHTLKDKLVGAHAHLTVESEGGIGDVEPLMRTVASTEHVVGVSPFVEGQAILRLPDRAFGVLVRGLDVEREPRVSKLRDYLVGGRLPQQDDEVAIGIELARAIGAALGDALQLLSPVDGSFQSLSISGVFRSGMYELDRNVVGVTIPKAQQLFRHPGLVSGLAVRLDRLEEAAQTKATLASQLGEAYLVTTWMDHHQTLFDALRLEKVVMSLILTLIVLVAAANIVSTLIMMVMEKTRDIGILKSIGASSRSIRWLFTWQGVMIGLLGTGLGASVAWGVVWLLDRYRFIRLPNAIYYLDYLPVHVEWGDWVMTVIAAVVISLLAAIYPARQAARLSPVEALRYE